MLPERIALAGFGFCGKDAAAIPLYERNFCRACLGDQIKADLDDVVRAEYGFSSFTEDREQKALIRPLLEQHGDDHYDRLFEQMFKNLPRRAVNTRLVRLREAAAWRAAGGVICLIERPGVGPATDWERDRLNELLDSGMVTHRVQNDSTVAALHEKILSLSVDEPANALDT